MTPVDYSLLMGGVSDSTAEECEEPEQPDEGVQLDVRGLATDSIHRLTMTMGNQQVSSDATAMEDLAIGRLADSRRTKDKAHLLQREKKLPANLGDIYHVRRNEQSMAKQPWNNHHDHELLRRRPISNTNQGKSRQVLRQTTFLESPPSSSGDRYTNTVPAGSLEKQVELVFRELDADSDGYLDEAEASRGLLQVLDTNLDLAANMEKNPAECLRWLQDTGKSCSGKVNLQDFKNILSSILRSELRAKFRKNDEDDGDDGPAQADYKKAAGIAHDSNGRWVVNPNSNLYKTWHGLITSCSIILIIHLPLTLGWEHLLSTLNIAMEALFMVDVALNFYTGYINSDDKTIMDLPTIRRHYIRGWFAIDLLSSFPADIIFVISDSMNVRLSLLVGKTFLKSLKVLRVAKVVRLGRSSPLANSVRKLNAYVETDWKFTTPALLGRLLFLLGLTFILSHWMGSLHFLTVRIHGFPEDSWAATIGLENETMFRQWSYAWFRGLAQLLQLGFESPPFTNTSCDMLTHWCELEHWMTLGCLYIGAIYNSFLISTILSIIQSGSMTKIAYHQRVGELNQYIKKRDLPKGLSQHIREHFDLNYTSHMFFDESDVVKSMSQHQIQSIRRHCARDLIKQVPILCEEADKGFTHCVTGYLKEMKVGIGQTIFQEHEVGDAMYFIMRGQVRLTASFDADGYADIGAGSFFGEVAVLTSVPRTMTAMAASKDCCLFRLDQESLCTVLELFPNTHDRFIETARRRLSMLQHVEDPIRIPRPDDDDADPEDAKLAWFHEMVRARRRPAKDCAEMTDAMDMSQLSVSKRE